MKNVLWFILLILCCHLSPVWSEDDPKLKKIMSHPRWIGSWPEAVTYMPDGQSILYLSHKDPRGYEVVEIDDRGEVIKIHDHAAFPSSWDRLGTSTIASWKGDLFLTQGAAPGRATRTEEAETNVRWLGAKRYAYQIGHKVYVKDLRSGVVRQKASILPQDPEKSTTDFQSQQQDRLFPVLKEREDARKRRQREQGIAKLRIGKERQLIMAELSNDEDLLLVVHAKKSKGKRDQMPHFVTRDGFVKTTKLGYKVGRAPLDHQLSVYNLKTGQRADIGLNALPAKTDKKKIWVEATQWSRSGRLALSVFSHDYEERWLLEIDLKTAKATLIEHLHDDAWHSWDHNEFGWTPDGKKLWYLSEKTGFAHLYLWNGQTNQALTKGKYEVSSVHPSPDGKWFYYRANAQRPSRYDVYRVDTSGQAVQVSNLGGQTAFDLAPDGKNLVLLHSKTAVPPEVFIQSSKPGAQAKAITRLASREFLKQDWTLPQIVQVPSTHHDKTIPAKLYLPPAGVRSNGAAVVFIHGAGYLQNSDEGWSYYFREFMFHTLLTRRGVVVLDMDYRASAGYGRDWRTAIYRQMGTPELQDLKDGVGYLVAKHGVGADRVGVYGGSYGGFLTLMALFKEPDLFACGAALRSVTDWSQYNHEYTARILNTPKEDAEAFKRSSPIEFAAGLKKPLLMAHGMLDNNVVAQDTIRLAQRLIQLKKENWEMALYPVEAHGFVEPESWLDEYRRILKLFEANLNI